MTIGIDSPAVTWGVGLFETMLVVNGRVPFFARHRARMIASAKTLGFPIPSSDELEREGRIAAGDVRHDEGALRCLWLASGTDLASPSAWRLVVEARRIPETTIARREHGRVILLDPALERSLPRHKTTSYLACVLGLRAAIAAGAGEGLFVDHEGYALEGTTTNIFAIRDDRLVTPPGDRVLPGITRGWVIENAERAGLSVVESRVTREDLLAGSFLTGSLTKLAAIRSVDGEPCVALPEAFDRLVNMYEHALERDGVAYGHS